MINKKPIETFDQETLKRIEKEVQRIDAEKQKAIEFIIGFIVYIIAMICAIYFLMTI